MTAWIKVNNVSIDIPIYSQDRSFRSALVSKYIGGNINTNGNKISIQALRNINFSLKEGDRLGLIGHNGAGKSTLLNTLGGIYKPLTGSIEHSGRITPLFHSSPGMDSVDSGINNIYTVGMFFGMTKKQITAKLDEIIDFTQLQDYIHLPVRTYSTGMIARLSFAIAACLEPDIMLVDEGIGAGDESFARKAKSSLDNLYKKVKIIILASHSRELIHQMCNKAILLEHGRMLAFGDIDEVFDIYDKHTQMEQTQ